MKRKLAALICVLVLLMLTACEAPPAQTVEPSPVLTVEATPTPSPLPAPSQEPEPELPEFPVLVAENNEWMIYLDAWDRTKAEGSVIDLSVYNKEGALFQKLRSVSEWTSPSPYFFQGENSESVAAFEDLNFDGVEDIKVIYETLRCGAYDAFLWNSETEKFIGEPTFSQIKRPHPMDGMIFGNCSGGAANGHYYAYCYDSETGYQLARDLNMDWIYENDEETGLSTFKGIFYTETVYENAAATGKTETWDYSGLDGFWDEYSRHDTNHMIKIED